MWVSYTNIFPYLVIASKTLPLGFLRSFFSYLNFFSFISCFTLLEFSDFGFSWANFATWYTVSTSLLFLIWFLVLIFFLPPFLAACDVSEYSSCSYDAFRRCWSSFFSSINRNNGTINNFIYSFTRNGCLFGKLNGPLSLSISTFTTCF